MVKPSWFSSVRNRKFGKGGARGWYGWRKRETDYLSDPPPKYSGDEYPADDKPIPVQRQLDDFFTPMAQPPRGPPIDAAALSGADIQRLETARAALVDNQAQFGTSPQPQTTTLSATQAFYNISPQNNTISRQPGTQVSAVSTLSKSNSTYTTAQVSALTREPGTQTTFLSQPLSDYNNTGTQNTFLTRQTSDAYDPNQREVNHLSYLSSLSSGFGDGLIIPDPTVNGSSQQGPRQSRQQTGAPRFSWQTSVRDTVYTTTSIDSAPRFRTVNSWVAQQSGRVERQQIEQEVPAIPAIPAPLQAGVDHQRKISEDPAFRYHPGDEIPLSGGRRVPSVILDRTIGHR